MKPFVRWNTALVAVFFLASPLQAETERHIEVSGRGVIHAAPDMAVLSVTFSKQDTQAGNAKTIVDTQIQDLLAHCKQLNIEDKDIQAARLTLYPEYDHENHRKLIGYRVSREVQIRIRNLLTYPKLLEGAVNIGASHTGQLQLDFSNRKELEKQALQAAFIDAKEQAYLLAKSSGDQLGKPLWIRASANHSPVPQRMRMMAEMKADASYPSGEMALSRQVQVRFELRD